MTDGTRVRLSRAGIVHITDWVVHAATRRRARLWDDTLWLQPKVELLFPVDRICYHDPILP